MNDDRIARQLFNTLGEHARGRAVEMLGTDASPATVGSFTLGYKTGIVDACQALRPDPSDDPLDIPRDQRQALVTDWAKRAFGEVEATSLPQRGVRLLEEAVEAFQACGGDEQIAHELVAFVFDRPPGTVAQELGGVAVTTLALAAAAGLSADAEERREIKRVLEKPVAEFTARNAAKNAAGFKMVAPGTTDEP